MNNTAQELPRPDPLAATSELPPSLASQLESILEAQPELLALGVAEIAKLVSLQVRVLQYRLRVDGDRFQLVRSRVRLKLAKLWLADEARSVNEISAMLGFFDRHSFSRTFRLWTGEAPSTYRQRQLAGRDGVLHMFGVPPVGDHAASEMLTRSERNS